MYSYEHKIAPSPIFVNRLPARADPFSEKNRGGGVASQVTEPAKWGILKARIELTLGC